MAGGINQDPEKVGYYTLLSDERLLSWGCLDEDPGGRVDLEEVTRMKVMPRTVHKPPDEATRAVNSGYEGTCASRTVHLFMTHSDARAPACAHGPLTGGQDCACRKGCSLRGRDPSVP